MSDHQSRIDPILYEWQQVVHECGAELSITVLAGGKRITGVLCPIQRYQAWGREILHRAMLNKGQFAIPPAAPDPLTVAQRDAIVADWPGIATRLQHSDDPFSLLYLRGADVSENPAMYSWSAAYLLVPVSHVSAFTLGAPTRGQ